MVDRAIERVTKALGGRGVVILRRIGWPQRIQLLSLN